MTCYQTKGANLTTCEISPEEHQSCSVVCELKTSGFHCVSECVDDLLCHNVTAALFVTFCCTTSLCNRFDTTTPTISELYKLHHVIDSDFDKTFLHLYVAFTK